MISRDRIERNLRRALGDRELAWINAAAERSAAWWLARAPTACRMCGPNAGVKHSTLRHGAR